MSSQPPRSSAPTGAPISAPASSAPGQVAIKKKYLPHQQPTQQQHATTPPQPSYHKTQTDQQPQHMPQVNGAGMSINQDPPDHTPGPATGYQPTPAFPATQLPSHPSPNQNSQASFSPSIREQPANHSHPSSSHPPNQMRGRPPAQSQRAPFQVRFPSPEAPERSNDPNFIAECEQLTRIIESAKPEVLHQVVRNSWEKAIKGSDYHNTFLMNILLNSAKHNVLTRAVKDFGKSWFRGSIRDLVKIHFDADIIDVISDLLLRKASTQHLDRAVVSRLETIEAQALVNMLGRAQRLGYTSDDIVEADLSTGNREVVRTMGKKSKLPAQEQQKSGSITAPGLQSSIEVPTNEEIKKLGIVFCESCERPCSGEDAFLHHAEQCSGVRSTKMTSKMCVHCGQVFSTTAACNTHREHKTCGKYNNAVTFAMSNMMQIYEQHVPLVRQPGGSTSQNGSRSTSPTVFASEQEALASLPVAQRQALETAMKDAESDYLEKQRAVMKMTDEAKRKDKLVRIKASFQSKQSIIRKKHGIRLRGRRSRTTLEADRRRLSMNQPASPQHSSIHAIGIPVTRPPDAVKAQSGLTGSTATAETEDPTAGQPQLGTSQSEPMEIDSDKTEED